MEVSNSVKKPIKTAGLVKSAQKNGSRNHSSSQNIKMAANRSRSGSHPSSQGSTGKKSDYSKSAKTTANGSKNNKSQNNIKFAERSSKYHSSRKAARANVQNQGGAAAISVAKSAGKKASRVFLGFDYPLFTIVIILLAFGLIMMFSASYATAYSQLGDSLFYLKRQSIFAAGGIVVMLAASLADYHIFKYRPLLIGLCTLSLGLMAAVKVIGTTQGGAERWIEIGGITFQPSEVLKFAIIVLFAYFTEKRFEMLKDFKKGFLPYAIALIISCGLLMLQPHLSGTIIVFAIGFAMMFVAGVRPKYMALMAVGTIILIAIAIPILKAAGHDYFGTRITSFLHPESDIQGDTFQTYQSLVTIGSGGLFGLGFGNSRQKYSYLPMSRNDFIFSIICEELGFFGAVLVILLFVILIIRGFYISSHARDKFGMMLAFGITFQIGLQALLNIAVVSNSIPNTGISLPFFSYGGSALLMQLGEMGVLLNISRNAELQ